MKPLVYHTLLFAVQSKFGDGSSLVFAVCRKQSMAAVKKSFPESGKSLEHGYLENWPLSLKSVWVSGKIYCLIIYDVTLILLRTKFGSAFFANC